MAFHSPDVPVASVRGMGRGRSGDRDTALGLSCYLGSTVALTWFSLSTFETVAGRAGPARQRPQLNEK